MYAAQDTRQRAPTTGEVYNAFLEGQDSGFEGKRTLKQSAELSRVFLWSSRSHTEILIEMNFQENAGLNPRRGEYASIGGSGSLV